MTKKWTLILAIVFAVLFAFCIIFFVVFPLRYKKEIIKYSAEYSLDGGLVASVIFVESRFNKNAKSSSGACGLMQLMPATFGWVKEELCEDNVNIFDPITNIKYGCFYLEYLFRKYKNEIYVLAAYNAGEGIVASWGESENFGIDSIKFSETKNYVLKILKYKAFYFSRLSI